MKIISISNHKGGVGKTTSTTNIGAGLANKKKRVLLIDMDPQANLTQSLGIRDQNKTVYSALKGEHELEAIEVYKNLEIIPSTLDLSGAEIELSAEAGREFILKDLIHDIKNKYDYVLIDTPPSLGLLTINAFTASHEVIIPLQVEYLAVQGLNKLLEVIGKIQKRLNKELTLGGILITQYSSRRVLNRNIAESVIDHFKEKVFKTYIRENIALAEAPTKGLDIFRYNKTLSILW